MPSLPATTHVQEDSQDARCAFANKHRLPVPTRKHPPTPQPSAQKAHTSRLFHTPPDEPKLTSRLRRWGWIPTHGPVERMLTSLPSPSEMALARQPGPHPQRTRRTQTDELGHPPTTPPNALRRPATWQQTEALQYRFATARRAPTRALQTVSSNGSPASIASLPTVSGAFDSLLRVLFIFPSRYLFAIGLSHVFSFR